MESVLLSASYNMVVLNKRCLCVSTTTTGVAAIAIVFVSLIFNPAVMLTKSYMKITNGSYFHKKLQEKIDAARIELYIFNITNSERFISGLDRKLKLEEVGPFTFVESREGEHAQIDPVNKVLRYFPHHEITFVPEDSVADPKDVFVFMPNTVFLAMASRLSTESLWLKASFEMFTNRLRSKPILKLTVNEVLWGYKDPFVDIGKMLVPGIVYFDKLGLLSFNYNRKREVNVELHTSDEKLFQIKSINGAEGFNELGFSKNRSTCNTFSDAYEGVLVPNVTPDKKVRLFHRVLCRLIDLEYRRSLTMDDGMEALEFRISNEGLKVENSQCNCQHMQCYKGVWDISPCYYEIPGALSLGHFLGADERVFERLEGMHPDEERHGSRFVIHKTIGIPLKTRFSLQCSLVVKDVDYSSAAKPFSNMFLPIVWGRADQLPLPADIEEVLQFVTVTLPKAVLLSQVILLFIGTCLLICSCRLAHVSLRVDFIRMRLQTVKQKLKSTKKNNSSIQGDVPQDCSLQEFN